jgi:hypothetical protein
VLTAAVDTIEVDANIVGVSEIGTAGAVRGSLGADVVEYDDLVDFVEDAGSSAGNENPADLVSGPFWFLSAFLRLHDSCLCALLGETPMRTWRNCLIASACRLASRKHYSQGSSANEQWRGGVHNSEKK